MSFNHIQLQREYDLIYSYFRTTCEPFDFLEWDGRILTVYKDEIIIEKYSHKDLKNIIFNLE